MYRFHQHGHTWVNFPTRRSLAASLRINGWNGAIAGFSISCGPMLALCATRILLCIIIWNEHKQSWYCMVQIRWDKKSQHLSTPFFMQLQNVSVQPWSSLVHCLKCKWILYSEVFFFRHPLKGIHMGAFRDHVCAVQCFVLTVCTSPKASAHVAIFFYIDCVHQRVAFTHRI